MMEPKVLGPIGKEPKITTGRILPLLVCLVLSIGSVSSKSELIAHEALSRFFAEGEAPLNPVHGLAAQHRMFRASKVAPPIVSTSVQSEPSEVNKTKEKTLPTATLQMTPSISKIVNRTLTVSANIEGSISGNIKLSELTTLAPSTQLKDSSWLESSRTSGIGDSEGVSSVQSQLSPSSLTSSTLSISHRHLESSMTSQKELPVSTWAPNVAFETTSMVQTLLSGTPGSSYRGAILTAELVSTASFPRSSFKSESNLWPDKRDDFWSIKPTTVKSQQDIHPTNALRSEDVQSKINTETHPGASSDVAASIAATVTANWSSVQEVTTARILFDSLSTERWSDGGILQQPSSDSQVRKEEFSLPAGTVAGIVVASIGFVAIVAAIFGLFIFRKFRGLNAKSYDNKYSADSCSYLDSLQVSYINNHIELPKESTEEMFSLDNDSFLNSLEAMTMENYWAEDRRSTRV